ncbi:PIN-like domain-containing protein [Fusobacterium polymorphum]|uniref:PIN-like domain-containing protein n=1 Tax=Fusobacterium nucleatum subsp. polymorphum TaxID=76857 RepID=UPI000B09BA3F|nr:PIN-like domain-containing protein [Fusobacterium polymorphum]
MEYNDFKSIIQQQGTAIVLDTNVILDLARYSLYTSKNILEIFNKCTDLIWIPNQVFKEYSKNKYHVFGNLRKRYSSFEKNLLSIIDDSEKKLKNVLNNSYKYKYFGNKILSNDILKKIEEFRKIITSYKDTVGTEYDEITSNSAEIIKNIEKFISDLETNKQIGKKISFNEQLKIIKEGELRYKYKLPPGFKDDKKEGIEKFGDLFIWKEILRLPTNKSINNIIFITNDEKDDWWNKDEHGYLEIRKELLDEFLEINPNVSIVFMTIGMFQKYASKLYSLYEFGVYVDLNRNDEFFIERVADRISDDIINKIYDNEYDYLESEDIGSEGIDYVDIEKCLLIGINKVYSNISNGEVCIIYELEYEIELYCDSYEYWGRDDDTKEIIKSPAIKHIFKGSVVVSIERIIQEEDIESNHNYLDEDEDYQGLEIIDSNIKQTYVNSNEDMYFDEGFDF